MGLFFNKEQKEAKKIEKHQRNMDEIEHKLQFAQKLYEETSELGQEMANLTEIKDHSKLQKKYDKNLRALKIEQMRLVGLIMSSLPMYNITDKDTGEPVTIELLKEKSIPDLIDTAEEIIQDLKVLEK